MVQYAFAVASGRQSSRGADESDTACLQAWDIGDKCFRLHGEGGQRAPLHMGEPRNLDYHLLVTVPFMGHRHLPLTDGLCLGTC